MGLNLDLFLSSDIDKEIKNVISFVLCHRLTKFVTLKIKIILI